MSTEEWIAQPAASWATHVEGGRSGYGSVLLRFHRPRDAKGRPRTNSLLSDRPGLVYI